MEIFLFITIWWGMGLLGVAMVVLWWTKDLDLGVEDLFVFLLFSITGPVFFSAGLVIIVFSFLFSKIPDKTLVKRCNKSGK